MEIIDADDTEIIVAAMMLLRENLFADLEEIEQRLGETFTINAEMESDELVDVLRGARTRVLSGLISVDEVLGWMRAYAPKDANGNELECVRELPFVTIMPMH